MSNLAAPTHCVSFNLIDLKSRQQASCTSQLSAAKKQLQFIQFSHKYRTSQKKRRLRNNGSYSMLYSKLTIKNLSMLRIGTGTFTSLSPHPMLMRASKRGRATMLVSERVWRRDRYESPVLGRRIRRHNTGNLIVGINHFRQRQCCGSGSDLSLMRIRPLVFLLEN